MGLNIWFLKRTIEKKSFIESHTGDLHLRLNYGILLLTNYQL